MSAAPLILLVEDDPSMREGIEDNLLIEGFEVISAVNCRDAHHAANRKNPHLIILDRMLPDGDGVSLCRDLRAQGFRRPIIMLTAKGEEMDRVIGLESGADDYVVKPFSLRELLARINAHIRRMGGREEEGWVQIGAALVDFARHRVARNGEDVEASSRELELLRFLVGRRGQVVSRETLLQEVWGRPNDVVTRTIDNFIVRLRKKIEPDPANPRYLLTVHGCGYKLIG